MIKLAHQHAALSIPSSHCVLLNQLELPTASAHPPIRLFKHGSYRHLRSGPFNSSRNFHNDQMLRHALNGLAFITDHLCTNGVQATRESPRKPHGPNSFSSRYPARNVSQHHVNFSNPRVSFVKIKRDFGSYSRNSETFSNVPNRIYRFLQKETKMLSETLGMDQNFGLNPINTSHLNESIQKELGQQMDDYNRLVVLLSHHPLAVPYLTSLEFYNSIPRVLPADKEALLKILMFNNAWDEFWTIIFSENTSLSDLEETVDLICTFLTTNKSMELGLWLALESAKKQAPNRNIFNPICELFQYKCGINSEKFSLFHQIIAAPSFSSVESLLEMQLDTKMNKTKSRLTDLKAFSIIKCASASSSDVSASQIIGQCSRHPDVHKIPGFTSMILTKIPDPHLASYFASHRASLYNERDLYYLIQMTHAERHYQLYLALCQSVRKGLIQSDYVINCFVMRTHLVSENVFSSLIKKHYRLINAETFSNVFISLIKTSEGRHVLRTISRRQNQKFADLVDKVIHATSDSSMLVYLLELSSKNERTITREILKRLRPQKDHIEIFLKHKSTEYNLTEIWRYGIRENLLDESNTGELFQKIIMKSWNVKSCSSRSKARNETDIDKDFREQFKNSTSGEKRRLKARLQAMAQALSLADASQIADTFNNLNTFLFRGKRFVIRDKFGKEYVLNHLIEFTMKYIFRSGEEDKRVIKMKLILKGLQFDSVVMQASAFQYMTMRKPEISLKILETYRYKQSLLNRPILNGIEQGILITPKLEKQDRILLFQNFQDKKEQLGFGTRLHPRTMALMGNLIFDGAYKFHDRERLKSFAQLARKVGVPQRVIKKWSAQM
ncbi:hypothetical protein OXX59_000056 [Metschnikowia pulcherrima]